MAVAIPAAQVPTFASAADLAARLGRAVWADGTAERAQVDVLLQDASAHLREVIGWQISPPSTVTATVSRAGGAVRLPGTPVTAVTSVTVDGVAVPASFYALEDGSLRWLSAGMGSAVVTYTVGYDKVPPEIASWTCVLASQALRTVADLEQLGGGGVSTIQLGDWRKSWAGGGADAGFVLPARVEEKLRSRYGSSVYVTG